MEKTLSKFDLRTGAIPPFVTPEQYVDAKLVMLEGEMYIHPTFEEIAHLRSLKTEGDIDRAVASIIHRHWD